MRLGLLLFVYATPLDALNYFKMYYMCLSKYFTVDAESVIVIIYHPNNT